MNLIIERRAEIALRSLRGMDEKRIQHALEVLESIKSKEIAENPNIYKALVHPSDKPLYIFRGRSRLRLIFAVEGETCTVLDLVDHDRLGRLLPKVGL